MLETKQIRNEDVPYELIYLADEDDDQIKKYKDTSIFWATMDNEKIIGIIGINEINKESTEIVCVAVDEEYQNKKIGTNLIEKAISVSKEKKYKEIIIKTGNCGMGQLYLYQRCGFRFDSINKDYMIENYKNPIYENDIQCFDQIVLKYRIYSKEELNKIIKEYWKRFIEKNEEYKESEYEVWSFGHTDNLANKLIGYVRQGKKTGTSSALEMYEVDEKVPEESDISIITHGNGLPGCVIKTEEIRKKRFKDITEEEARLEGEGDLSLEYWRNVHEHFFRNEYEKKRKKFSEDIPVIFERFEVIYDEYR
ncbi:GNAT family N-acetyltransferase [Sediminispirochaeta bajacaliforniensis]|uniref:GNAT family N-acetyltransferase n=1 Tax=Sediminispirochaeta bajacaliforniensis TaxID=148 RepID=UPI0003648729|nr:GNAT family N-acetyltransferase [Sediminispirochaeta bajacaliforniensis]